MSLTVTCSSCHRSWDFKPWRAAKLKDPFRCGDCRRFPVPPEDELRRLYFDARLSSTQIGSIYGVNFTVVFRWFEKYGIQPRSTSEAKRLDMERWSYEDRLRITESSRAIFTGRPRTNEDRSRRAIGVEQAAKLSHNEEALLLALRQNGLNPIPQMAIDKFNIDLAFLEYHLAIEIDGGCWHNTPKHVAGDKAKAEFLEASGWNIIRIKTRRQKWVDLAVSRIKTWLTEHPLNQQQRLDLV